MTKLVNTKGINSREGGVKPVIFTPLIRRCMTILAFGALVSGCSSGSSGSSTPTTTSTPKTTSTSTTSTGTSSSTTSTGTSSSTGSSSSSGYSLSRSGSGTWTCSTSTDSTQLSSSYGWAEAISACAAYDSSGSSSSSSSSSTPVNIGTVSTDGTWRRRKTGGDPGYIYLSCKYAGGQSKNSDGTSSTVLSARAWIEWDDGTLDTQTDSTTNQSYISECRSYVTSSWTRLSSTVYTNTGVKYAGLLVMRGLAQISPTGEQLAQNLAALSTDQQARALQQIAGKTISSDFAKQQNLVKFGGDAIGQRITALSSKLAITDGKSAIERANFSGNPMNASQSSMSLANQSIDAGKIGMWVSLSPTNGLSSKNGHGNVASFQAGQDVALSPNFIVGIAASNGIIANQQNGNTPSYLNGNLIGTNVYSTYSEGDWRFSTNFGAHQGNMEMIRTIDLSDRNLSSGKTTLIGSSGEARIGYELMGSKTISVIPSLALGNRNSRSKAYNERATAEYLALAVPSYAQNSNYLALGFDVRMLQNWGSAMIMPRLSVSYEQANRNTKQYGDIGFVADKDLLLTTNSSGRQNIGTTNFAVGVDILSSDEGHFALRGDYKASVNREENVQNLTIGTKIGF